MYWWRPRRTLFYHFDETT